MNGIYHGWAYEKYAAVAALNGSSLVHMMRSPLSYLWHKNNPQPPSDAMQLGILTHRMILEPDLVGDFAVWGIEDGQNTRRGKTWDRFAEDHKDQPIITVAERDAMVGIAVAVRRNPDAAKYLHGGRSEVSLFWNDKAFDREMKGRVDYLSDTHKATIVDLKTTRDCQPFRFGNQAYRLGYHIKLAIYVSGVYTLTGNLPEVKLIAVESKPPYESAVYNVPREVLDQGHEDYTNLMQKIVDCEADGTWPGANESESDLSLPTYAYGETSDDLSELELTA